MYSVTDYTCPVLFRNACDVLFAIRLDVNYFSYHSQKHIMNLNLTIDVETNVSVGRIYIYSSGQTFNLIYCFLSVMFTLNSDI